jgi:hypothetical protein
MTEQEQLERAACELAEALVQAVWQLELAAGPVQPEVQPALSDA